MSKMRFFALQELANRKPLEVEIPSNKLTDYYGSHVFDRKKMQEYLPKEAYQAVVNAIEKGTPINRATADLVANGITNIHLYTMNKPWITRAIVENLSSIIQRD